MIENNGERTIQNTILTTDIRHTGQQAKRKPIPHYVARMPLDWCRQASCLSGSATRIGVLLWYRAGLTKKKVVTLPSYLVESFGIDRGTKSRALAALANAGLVRLHNVGSGRAKRIELLIDPNVQRY